MGMDIKSLIFGFILGMLTLIMLFWLIIFLANRRFIKNSIKASDLNNEDIKKMISSKQKRVIKSTKLGITHNVDLMQNITKELIYDIAEYFYPKSKHPHLEISLIEALDLNERITERIKHILEIKGIGLVKRVRLSQIVSILEIKNNIENNTLYKFSKKYNLDKVVKYGYTALNAANPAYWVRKLIYTSTLETSFRSISIVTLNVVGEEATRLYSQKVIDNKDDAFTDQEIQKAIEEYDIA